MFRKPQLLKMSGGLAGFEYDLFGIDIDLNNLLNQAVNTGANLVQSQAAAKVTNAETSRLLAEAETTTALGKLKSLELNAKTVTIIALVAGAGMLGYLFLSKSGHRTR